MNTDITVFSFHPVKIITTAEGGMALTNDKKLAKRLELFRSHGVTREVIKDNASNHAPWYYQQIELGYNYRMTDIHAALGITQLKKIDEFIEKRHLIADAYNDGLQKLPLQLPFQAIGKSSYHLYVISLLKNSPISKLILYNFLKENGIVTNVHYIPVHLHPYYQKLGFFEGEFPEAEKYYDSALSLPIYPNLSKQDQSRVISVISEAFML